MFLDKEGWQEVYDMFDGTMPLCLGRECLDKCCKPRELSRVSGEKVQFYTSFLDEGELALQSSLFPGFADLGINVTVINDVLGKDGNPDLGAFVTNCINADGSCKMSGRKQFHCRFHPFRLHENEMIAPRCPQAVRMIENCLTGYEFLGVIFRIRSRLGFTDNFEWFGNLGRVRAFLLSGQVQR